MSRSEPAAPPAPAGPDPAEVRPLVAADVPAAAALGHEALREAGTRYGFSMPPLDDAVRVRQERRVAHLLATDPDGVFVADDGGEVVGVALALVRGPLWYLSLLAVQPGRQARGLGARLIEAALRTAQDRPAALIMASSDPKALRRYGRAGFALLPGFEATGPVDRSLLPAVSGVRDGDWERDAERVDDLAVRLRGAPYGPDLRAFAEQGARLLVADDGFAVLRGGGVAAVGAGDPATATSLLWAGLAESDGEVEIGPLTAAQQWAVEVALAARLAVAPGSSLCVRGALGPMTPYLPSGAYG